MDLRHRTIPRVEDSLLVLIDCQERLFPVIQNHQELAGRLQTLLAGAGLLEVPVLITEQYKKGLGSTVPAVRAAATAASTIEKLTFSCFGDETFLAQFHGHERGTLVLCGIETHICVLQTALDALAEGYQVQIVADAVGSRSTDNRLSALERLRDAGAVITCVESLLFEWMVRCDHPKFKEIQRLVK